MKYASMNDDVIGIILSHCDCASDYNSQSLVCRRWYNYIVRLFPNADVLFPNPIRMLMKAWNINQTPLVCRSKWFSYEENKKSAVGAKYFVVVDIGDLERRIDALKNFVICPSYLSTDDEIVWLFLDAEFLRLSSQLNKFFIKNTHYLNENIISMLANECSFCVYSSLFERLAIDRVLSVDYVSKMIVDGRVSGLVIEYHQNCVGGITIDHILRSRSSGVVDYARACYFSGFGIVDVWIAALTNLGKYKNSIDINVKYFLDGMSGLIDFNYFWDELIPTISNYSTRKMIMYSVRWCTWTWKDLLVFQYKNKHELLGWAMKYQS